MDERRRDERLIELRFMLVPVLLAGEPCENDARKRTEPLALAASVGLLLPTARLLLAFALALLLALELASDF